jgi:mannosyltransferase
VNQPDTAQMMLAIPAQPTAQPAARSAVVDLTHPITVLPVRPADNTETVRFERTPGPAPVKADDPGRRALSQLACITAGAVMAVLGVLRLDWPGLWGDELATWGMSTVRWPEIWGQLSTFDVVIGPYYALIHAWTDLVGLSDMTLRIPSVIAMTGAAMVVAAVGNRLAGPRVGIVAGVLFAVLPTSSRFAQEARPYALATFMAALATLLLLRALDRPGAFRLAGYVLAIAALGLLHAVALAVLAAHLVTVLALARRSLLWWLPAAIAGAVPGAALLWLGYQQKAQISWLPLATPNRLVDYPGELIGVPLVGGAIIAFALLAVSLRRPAVVYAAWALVPTALVYAAATVTPLWTTRYLLFTLPGWALLAATALSRAPFVRGALAIVAIAALGIPSQVALRQADGHSQDTRGAAAVIAARVQSGDGIIYGTKVDGRVGRDLMAHYLPPAGRPKDLLVVRPPRTGGQTFASECPKPETCLGRAGRIWLFRVGTWKNPLDGLDDGRDKALSTYQVAQVWHPTKLTVALLILRRG